LLILDDWKDQILINDFKYFLAAREKVYINLELYLNSKKTLNFEKDFMEITSFKRYFSQGKFFLFILLNETTGLKILRPLRGRDPYKEIKKIIKIQKILYENDLAFDCGDDVLEIPIKDINSNTQHIFNGYITNTDIKFDKLKERYKYSKRNFYEISNVLLNIFKKHNINRKYLSLELLENKNYVLTNKNEHKFVDIDPKFYFIEQP